MLGSWPLLFVNTIVIVGLTDWLDIYMYMHFFLTSKGIACHATTSGANQTERVYYSYRDQMYQVNAHWRWHHNVTFSHRNYNHIIICVQ